MHLKELKNLLKGKKIALVGPSPSLVAAGKTIDKYDIIVRIKKGFPIPKKMVNDIGKKTDIIYSNLRLDNGTNNLDNKTIKAFYQQGGKAICYPYPVGNPDSKNKFNYACDRFAQNYLSFPHRNHVSVCIEEPFWKKITTELNTRPTIGMIAMADLVRYLPKELYITGFTFRMDSNSQPLYRASYKNAKQTKYALHTMTTVHDAEKELTYLVTLMKKYPQIRVDAILEKIINQNMHKWNKDMQHTVYQYWKREKAIRDKIQAELNKIKKERDAIIRKNNPPARVKHRKKPPYRSLGFPSAQLTGRERSPKKNLEIVPIDDLPLENAKKSPVFKRIFRIKRKLKNRKPLSAKPQPEKPQPEKPKGPPNKTSNKTPGKIKQLKWKRIVLVQSSITKKFNRV